MAQETTDVLVAGYQDIDAATADFDALVALVKEKKVAIEGVILVTHAEDGAVAVRQTGDNSAARARVGRRRRPRGRRCSRRRCSRRSASARSRAA